MATQQPWQRTHWSDAAQIAQLVDPDTVPAAAAGLLPHDWFGRLLGEDRLADAVKFLAHALPRYECTVWAVQSLIAMGAVDRRDPLVVAAMRWADQPTDELRRAAATLAEQTRGNSPARLLAETVMLSGGSLAPIDTPAVLPLPDTCAKLASGAILTGAFTLSDPKAALRRALAMGEAIAAGQR